MLISEHDLHPPALEGMEAYSSDPYDGPDPPPPPGCVDGADGGDTDAESGGEVGGEDDADDDDVAESDDDTESFDDNQDSGGDDGADDGGDAGGDASATLAAETLEAPAGSVVSAHSHVVPAGGIAEADEKKNALNVLLKIAIKDKNDTLTTMLRKTVLDDGKVKGLGRTDVAVALGTRVLAVQEENAKRHRSAAQDDFSFPERCRC